MAIIKNQIKMKIQANELRIGNFINQKFIKGNYRDATSNVIKVSGTFISGVDRYYKEFSKSYEPVPITEEWLLKFGFVLRGFYYHFPNHEIFKIEQHKLNNAYWLRHRTESLDSVRINYVHQLQNLYFALTGKELTYVNNPD